MALRRTIITFLLLLAGGLAALGKSAEERAFEAAANAFNDAFYPRAEQQFAEFAQTFTNSERLPEAILLQAEARYRQTNYDGALKLLKDHEVRAGKWTDEYLFWQAEARLGQGDIPGAVETYEKLTRDFPGSRRRLQAAVAEASALARAENWDRVVEVLQRTNGVFQAVLRTNLVNDWVLRGYLTLGEAYLATKNFRAAEDVLQPMGKMTVAAPIAWKRQFLLCRIQLADNRPEEALRGTTNLLSLATETGQAEVQAESASFQAGILERLGRIDEAIATYTNNLAAKFSPERQRQAILKLAELSLLQGKLEPAAQRLEEFLARYPQTPTADLAWFTLGELRLRQCALAMDSSRLFVADTNSLSDSNCLERAAVPLRTVIAQFGLSPLVGRAQLDLGWCYWLEGKMPESEAAFGAAAQSLPSSTAQALAYYKLADTQFRQTNYSAAAANYNAVVERFADFPEAKSNLLESALYQCVKAAVAAGDIVSCTNALQKILTRYPTGFNTERAVLVAGQWFGHERSPAEARDIFLSFSRLATNATLLPEVQLAIAQTYEQETNWEAAIKAYDGWFDRFSAETNIVPRAQYYRGRANYYAGREASALTCFTNLVARFPTNELTPLAQLWVADYHFGKGNYWPAEDLYQNIALTWPTSPLAYQARLMAGRSAFYRQGLPDAKVYFMKLYSDTNCPLKIQLQALYAYGATSMSMGDSAQTNKGAGYTEAINAFDGVVQRCLIADPTNALLPLALGEKANCLMQLRDYDTALATYQRVVTNTQFTSATTRCVAKSGMAAVLEKQAEQESGARQIELLTAALNHYLDVFYDDELLDGGDNSGLFWKKEAGKNAARLAETLKQWSQAAKLYERLAEMVPALRASFESKKVQAEKNIPARAAN
jgi:TolA-binding protein